MVLSSFRIANDSGWAYLESAAAYNQSFPPEYLQVAIITPDGTVYPGLDPSSPFFFDLGQNNPPYFEGKYVGVFRNIKPGYEAQIKSLTIRGGPRCGWNWSFDSRLIYCNPETNIPKTGIEWLGPWATYPGSEKNPTPVLGYNSQHLTTPTTPGPIQIDFPYPAVIKYGDGIAMAVADPPGVDGTGVWISGAILGRYVEVEN